MLVCQAQIARFYDFARNSSKRFSKDLDIFSYGKRRQA